MKHSTIIFLVLYFFSVGNGFGQYYSPNSTLQKSTTASISDSVNLIKHTIFLDVTDFQNAEKRSVCTIDFEALLDSIVELPLDLKDQVVDSVVHSSGLLSFDYTGEKLTIQLPTPLYSGMTDQLTVHYHGGAVTDPSGFGGFYFDANIAYNIGVAFTDWPPSYGRAWFPCFDNFVEKSTFEFQVLTSGGRSAWCNGLRQSIDTISGDTVLTTWIMNQEISSYLASVVVADYDETLWNFESISGDIIPVHLAGNTSQLASMETRFQNLQIVFDAFEQWFGPYRWPKIGFTLTPIGAMEHSTNIAFPQSILGSPVSEAIMAHELAHEWFGNLVTCNQPADMWLNEGWSEFLSILAYEAISGPEEYAERMRTNHRNMLHKAHLIDGDYLTMSAIPPELTYGEHVYNKGACVAHSLRGYLGDDLFFEIMKQYLEAFAFDNSSSINLRDFINTHPLTDVTDFFADWVFQPGWTQFSVDEMTVNASGDVVLVSLGIQQRLKAAPEYYHNVPVTLTMMDENWIAHEQQITVGGLWTDITVIAPFEPVFATLNRDEKLTYAVTAEENEITESGGSLWSHAYAYVFIDEVTEPTPLRIEHNWVGPGGEVENPDYIVSPDRYWRIAGPVNSNFNADIRFEFDARNNLSGNLDPELFAASGDDFSEENLVILYRNHPAENWTIWEEISIHTLGSATNGHARITAHQIVPGEYTFGNLHPNLGMDVKNKANFTVFPNPTSNALIVDLSQNGNGEYQVELFDSSGKLVFSEPLIGNRFQTDVSALPRGAYIIAVAQDGLDIGRQPVILQ